MATFTLRTHCRTRVFTAALVLLFVGITGCGDVPTGFSDTAESADQSPKLRHAHLMERAMQPGASKNGNALGLILATNQTSALQKQKVLERFKVLERYKVLERHSYEEAINGWAIEVEDSLGQGDFNAFLDSLDADPDITWYEPDFGITMPPSSSTPGGSGQELPWSIQHIGGHLSPAVSGDGSGSVPVDVYVLDTGVAQADNNDPNDDFALVNSIDFREGMNDAKDYDGHGTHIAGIIAAVDDGDGIVGVAPGARVHNLKVLGDDGLTDVSVVIAAVEYLINEKLAHPSKPMVVNMSLGEDIGTPAYTALDEAISEAISHGIIFVVAAGNQGKDVSHITPAHVAEAITVGSYGPTNFFSSFSNRGPGVDVLAPGEQILSLGPGGDHDRVLMTGTSMATAHVTGAVALYLWAYPSATPAQIHAEVMNYTKPIILGTPSNTTNRTLWIGL
ncbi:MAG: S8 family serine peptidase [Rhodothermales bacterium]|nr:S8 family serine peptidase [Rhodothermales bacterium]